MQVSPQKIALCTIFFLIFLTGVTFELKQFFNRIAAIESISEDALDISKFNAEEVKALQEKIEELEAEIEDLKN